MLDLFGNHIVGFPMRQLIYFIKWPYSLYTVYGILMTTCTLPCHLFSPPTLRQFLQIVADPENVRKTIAHHGYLITDPVKEICREVD